MPKTLTPLARKLRRQATLVEQLLWRELRASRLDGLKFRRQHRVAGRIADFACSEAKLIVEVDGAVHELDDVALRDVERTELLEAAGWRVIRFRNDEVMDNIIAVTDEIRRQALARLMV